MTRSNTKNLLKFGMILSPVMMIAVQPAAARDRNVEIVPYLEVQQVLVADLKNGNDVLTYTTVAVGGELSVETRQAKAQVNLRYERRFFYSDGLQDDSVVSGLARASVQVVPNALAFEVGGLATRSRTDLRGRSPINAVGSTDNVSQVYSVYAGPTLSTTAGSLDINADYRAGYTRVESGSTGALPAGQQPIEVFDDSISHSANASIGMEPGDLPFGWQVSGAWEREDSGNLDQRYDGKYGRVDVTVPVTPTLAVVGGIGYEDIQISERDAVRDANGNPVVGNDGRLVTDDASPRMLSYDEDGLIWDAGVLWRPSRRTSVEARVGERYGSMTYSGSLGYQPNENTSLNVTVYDTVSGFGNLVNDQLASLGTNFQSSRNPLSGELNGCAFGQGSSVCLNDLLQSAASSSFRARGVNAGLEYAVGGWNTNLGVGYQRRRFFAAQLGAVGNIDGLTDQNYYAYLGVSKELDRKSSFDANLYANLQESGLAGAESVLGIGANAAYYRQIIPGLSGTVAAGIDHYSQDGVDNELTASALLGLRYDF